MDVKIVVKNLKKEFERHVVFNFDKLKDEKKFIKYMKTFGKYDMKWEVVDSLISNIHKKFMKNIGKYDIKWEVVDNLISNIHKKFKSNLFFNISNYKENNETWYIYFLKYFNNFLNKKLNEYNSKFRINAIYFELGDDFFISMILHEVNQCVEEDHFNLLV